MKKYLLVSILIMGYSTTLFSQKPLSKKTIEAFHKVANYNYSNNLNQFKIVINGYFIRRGLEFSDAALAVEVINKDIDSREKVIEAIGEYGYLIRDKNRFFNYLYDLGMTAISAKELSEYAIEKYGIKIR